jgi:hypothetical protein
MPRTRGSSTSRIPVGIITRALLDDVHRAVGLCNVAIPFQRLFAEMLGVQPADVQLDHAGRNHFTLDPLGTGPRPRAHRG